MKLSPLTKSVRSALRRVADPARAPGMQAYMKSTMPYLGASAPNVRAACQEVFGSYEFDDAERWQADVLGLWRGAEHREERYAAIALSGHRKAKPFQSLAILPMYEEMIVTGAWWDYVDEIASNRIGPMLRDQPGKTKKTMLAWSHSPNMWKRRTSILSQIRSREATDLEHLYACIAPSLDSKAFFLRKAIGWALREVAWFNPDEVVRWVAEHEGQLSGLSRREALKNVERARPASAKRSARGTKR